MIPLLIDNGLACCPMATVDEQALRAALRTFERAASQVVKATDSLNAARDARDDGLRAIAAAGVPAARVSELVREHLKGKGWTPEQIAAVGVSVGTVKLARRRR